VGVKAENVLAAENVNFLYLFKTKKMLSAISRHKDLLLYSLGLAILLIGLRWLEFRFLLSTYSPELFTGAIAFVFTALGIWLALKLAKPKTVVVEKEVAVYIPENDFVRDHRALKKTGISPRELEVLELMAEGLSNAEIADKLFVSLNTVKTHSSKIFEKLEVKRRTQAVETAKRMQLIA
jgi:two-component system, NarL family, response regulator LiaR